MAKLSRREQEMLESLKAKAEAPDRGPVGRTLSASIDLSDPKQIKLAQKYGFLDDDDDDDEGDDDDAQDNGGDETPRRRGFFDDK